MERVRKTKPKMLPAIESSCKSIGRNHSVLVVNRGVRPSLVNELVEAFVISSVLAR